MSSPLPALRSCLFVGLLSALLAGTVQAQVPRATTETAVTEPAGSPGFPAPADSLQSAMPGRLNQRLPLLAGGLVVSYSALMLVLSKSWYTGEKSRFHWFNDLPQWKQLDKAGHIWGAFHESRGAVDMLRWAGVPDRRSIWYGGFVGFVLQAPIELFDGRDPAYGASASDLAANFLGSAGLISQQLAWNEVRIMPKLSFRTTRYADLRPNVLGRGLGEQFLKDYNGQTYWLATDVGAFLPAGNRWPRWLQPAVGYGAQQMVFNDPQANAALGLRSYRQFYLSLDVDLRRIPTRNKVLKKVFYALSIFHLPAPALEWNPRHGFRAHGLYW
ncbi:YfiM family protein [Hymenobacter lapidiphilus]|uniref:YfiM family protein n=1 Tax=Hymenobacter lapidiphilus TaxID=2608003 RepID=UPI001FEC5885|nr:YfiM family protein [Hymenobacter lapidiphilus]